MEKETPLLAVLRSCTPEERVQLAEIAGTTENYLYSIAGLHREPLVTLALAIERASRTMHAQNADIPVVTADQLAASFEARVRK